MAKLDILYHELIEMGFERYDYEDSVFYRQNGYHPFVLTFALAKNFKMEIGIERDYATLYKAEKKPYDRHFRACKQFHSKEMILLVFDLFGFDEKGQKIPAIAAPLR